MKLFLNQIGVTSIAILLATATCNNSASTENESQVYGTEELSSSVPAEEAMPTDSAILNSQDDTVSIVTTLGTIKVRLYKETPKHKENFVKLCKSGFYNGILFHRVINGFMIQGGDPNSVKAEPGAMYGNGGPGYTVPAEFNPNFRHKRGALAAARMGDQVNPMKESSGSQFYICHGSPFELDMNYTVFGETIDGITVVDAIANSKTDQYDRPLTDIKIISTTVLSGVKTAEPAKSDKPDTTKGKKGKSKSGK